LSGVDDSPLSSDITSAVPSFAQKEKEKMFKNSISEMTHFMGKTNEKCNFRIRN
jgi:hypothetical protein